MHVLRRLRRFSRHESGASMVEFAIVAALMFALVGGVIDFSYAFYQWNAASKALQAGVRLASVSDPVVTGLQDWKYTDLVPGDPMPTFKVVCQGGQTSCTCTGTFPSGSVCTLDATAMGKILNGRDGAPGAVEAGGLPGMKDVFWRIKSENVIVTYEQGSSIGFAGRPGGPVPTITIELTNLKYDFIFIGPFVSSSFMNMPPMATSATGEDLRGCGLAAC